MVKDVVVSKCNSKIEWASSFFSCDSSRIVTFEFIELNGV